MKKFLLTGLCLLGALNVDAQSSAQKATDLPYNYGFETADLDEWSVINAGDGNQWEVHQASAQTPDPSEGLKYMMYYFHENAANTYLFSKGLNLKAGQELNLKFDYMGIDFWFPEKMEVLIGTAATVEAQTQQLWINEDITNYPYTEASVNFTVPADGVYYIAFRAFSDADQFYLSLDNIRVKEADLSTSNVNKSKISYYPNPAKNILNIDHNQPISQILIYDLTGKLIKKEEVNASKVKLNISDLAIGQYMVRVQTKEGSKVFKIIKD